MSLFWEEWEAESEAGLPLQRLSYKPLGYELHEGSNIFFISESLWLNREPHLDIQPVPVDPWTNEWKLLNNCHW